MHKLIIVCGLPGSGKTMLADELSRRTGIACLHKDSIKEKLFEGLGMSTIEESGRIGKLSVDMVLYIAERQASNNVDVIIEAPFNFVEDYALFSEWVKRYGVRLYSVICSIDIEERRRRFDNRKRHVAHFDECRLSDHFSDDEEYDYASIPGKQIRINTNEPVSKLAERVISKLD